MKGDSKDASMDSESKDSSQVQVQNGVTSFSLWQGLAGVAVLMGVILWMGPYSSHIEFLPDQGASWYYWKLPEPTTASQLSAWICYSLHQVSMWAIIYHAQQQNLRYVEGLHPINIVALAVNAFFVLLHIAQTKLWYDGLAQNTSPFSSQASVVLLLVMVLIMEHRRRGLFFGYPTPLGRSLVQKSGAFLRQYHGYYFCWAITYTFWYHPMETTSGHLLGTAYALMIMLEGSLFFTNTHRHCRWTTALEVAVLIHGTAVAYQAGQAVIGQFLFGFWAMFVLTQMHGLGWSRTRRWWVAAVSVGAMIVFYWNNWGAMAREVPRIPIVEYGVMMVLVVVLGIPLTALSAIRDHHRDSPLAILVKVRSPNAGAKSL